MSPVELFAPLLGAALKAVEHLLEALLVMFIGGKLLAHGLRETRLTWTWSLLGLPIGFLLIETHHLGVGLILAGASYRASRLGARWHGEDVLQGADLDGRLSIGTVINEIGVRLRWTPEQWVRGDRLIVGREQYRRSVSIPIGHISGRHTLIVGATGSGKTVTQAWIVGRMVEAGHGAVVVDPKGDPLLRSSLERTARRVGKSFLEWTPEGPLTYNPYANGAHTEITDKALAGEKFTEPHYLRLAQRYLGHAIRAMHAAKLQVTPASLMGQLDPRELEVTARGLPDEHAAELQGYLDSFSERQRRDLAGVRDRLSILAESDIRQWLEPADGQPTIDLKETVTQQAVVYFRLDADRRMLLSRMIAAAIVSDLVTLIASLQANPVPTVVAIDEFSAIAGDSVSRLFSRGRSAGVSLVLGTQELADLNTAAEGFSEQVRGNVSTLIAHRQSVPESAETVAATAGTKPVWITTEQTGQSFFGTERTGRGSRTRGHEFVIHPSRIKELQTGCAVVVTPGAGRPRIARIHHPNEALR
jgi:conjugal transfer pilus assembly protein TraD